MSYQVTSTSYENYVSVSIIGTWTADKPEIILDEIYSKWAKHQKPDLLVDISKLWADQSIISEYYASEIFENVGFQSIRLIAIIDDPERKKINDFLEPAAHNRGLRLRFFYESEQEAADWLYQQGKIQC
jgi:hypothetical protein